MYTKRSIYMVYNAEKPSKANSVSVLSFLITDGVDWTIKSLGCSQSKTGEMPWKVLSNSKQKHWDPRKQNLEASGVWRNQSECLIGCISKTFDLWSFHNALWIPSDVPVVPLVLLWGAGGSAGILWCTGHKHFLFSFFSGLQRPLCLLTTLGICPSPMTQK